MAEKEHETDYHYDGKCFYRTGSALPKLDKKAHDHKIIFHNRHAIETLELRYTVKKANWTFEGEEPAPIEPKNLKVFDQLGSGEVAPGEPVPVKPGKSATFMIKKKIINEMLRAQATLNVYGEFEPTKGCPHPDGPSIRAHTEWHIEC